MDCESCKKRLAMHTVEFADGVRFRVCSGCLAENDRKRGRLLKVVHGTG